MIKHLRMAGGRARWLGPAAVAACLGLASMAFASDGADSPFATLGPSPEPPDNPVTPEKVELGKMLYWDGRLSGNNAMPCVSCHIPGVGWGAGSDISPGYTGTVHWRHSQTVLNSAYYDKLFWEGSVTDLETQAAAAATGAVGGNGDPAMMEMKLRLVPDYVERFREVYGTEWPNVNDAWDAIAAFERTIVTDPGKVPFDRYLAGDKGAISEEAKRGMALFEGEAGCAECHNGALLSDQKFYNLGVPENPIFEQSPLHQITLRWQVYQKGASEAVYREADRDLGLYHTTKRPQDKGRFRTPSLRETLYTAPYMHNGVFETLEEVVAFYNAGGGPDAEPGLLEPLGLSERDQADLVAFLRTLSMDEPLIVKAPELPESRPLD